MNRGLIVADCREVRTLKAALAWATQFGKLRPEIRDQVFDQTFMELGTNLMSSRPPNKLSVHGAGRRRAWTIARVRGEYNTATVVEFIREHCEQQRAARRRWMGIKISLSIDPLELSSAEMSDLDQTLTTAVESACNGIGRTYYSEEDMSFILGVNCGIKGHAHNGMLRNRRRLSDPGKPPPRSRIHVHVLLLPTAIEPGSEPKMELVLEALRGRLAGELLTEPVRSLRHRSRLPTLNEEARIRAAALATGEAFSWQADNVIFGNLLENRSRVLNEFRKQLDSLDGDGLRKCHGDIRSQSARSVGLRLSLLSKEAEILQATAHRLSQDWLIYQADQRIKAAQLLDGVRAGDPSVRFFDTPTAKALVRNRGGSQWKLPASTIQTWDRLFCEVADMRKVIRIALLALACQMGIKLAPHVGASYDMSWIYALGKMAEDRW